MKNRIPVCLLLGAIACSGRTAETAPETERFDERVAVFVLADSAMLDSLHSARGDDEFYVIADDMNWYRSEASDWLEQNGIATVYLEGRPSIAFVVDGVPVPFDYGEETTLDVVVLYDPGKAPLGLAPVEVGMLAPGYFGLE